MEHLLQYFLLVHQHKRSDNTVIGIKLAEPHDQMGVQPILKLLADTDWKLSLARKWAHFTHHLLKIYLDAADNLVAIAIYVHLVYMVQHRIGLIAISRA
jgi:hypothetical protein